MNALQRGRLCVIGAGLCWSVVGAGVKFVSPPLDGWHIAGGRSLFAFFFLCAVLQPWRHRQRPSLKVALLSVVYAAMLILFILANTRTLSANAIFLQDSALIWILLLAPLLLKEPFRPRDLGVFVICALGMALLFKDQLQPGQMEGNVLALVSGVAYAVVLMALRWGRAKEVGPASVPAGRDAGPTDAEQIILWGNLLGVLACLPQMGPLPQTGAALPFVIVALMGVVQLGLGYYLAACGMTHVPAVEASLLTLIEPVLNPIWAFLVVGEVPGPWALLGGAIIIAGVAYQAVTQQPAGKVSAESAVPVAE